jgi:DNA-binding transcriptional LysR family regulator
MAAEISRMDLAIAAVRADMGIAIAPMGTEYQKLTAGLLELPVPKGLPEVGQGIVYREDRYVPRYMEGFIEITSGVMAKGALAKVESNSRRRSRK